MYPLKFQPVLKQTLWGGDKIISYKQLDENLPNVGESWEVSAVEGYESVAIEGPDKGQTLSQLLDKYKEKLIGKSNFERFGNRFPLLVKFIDATQDLSIQVHPDEMLAKQRHGTFGKNEMWYVVDAETDAKLILGLSRPLTPDEYKERVTNGTFVEVLQTCNSVRPGDAFYVPAGRVHSIGKGVFVVEIQQASDITYRIYDYNRKDQNGNLRQLHTAEALEAIDFADVQNDFHINYERVPNEPAGIISTPYFTTSFYELTEPMTCDYSELDSFVIFVCVGGSCRLLDSEGNATTLVTGETVLLPAELQDVTIYPEAEGVKLLETYV